MAYDPYESRRGWRDPRATRSRDDRFGDREDRGFFERAGDEIASWFGDEDAERRRFRDDPERDRRFERGAYGRDADRDFGPRQRQSEYRPLTGDYGRSEFERGRPMGRGDFAGRYGYGSAYQGDTFDRGSSQRFPNRSGFDPQYGEWRQRQIDSLDRDYDEYRRENQSRF